MSPDVTSGASILTNVEKESRTFEMQPPVIIALPFQHISTLHRQDGGILICK